ncbi:MAG TPA: hypothetical protein DCK87_04685 [Desulfotomaculum sp.]|nr:hypothetical protein [Desulfotomaculum sp.]
MRRPGKFIIFLVLFLVLSLLAFASFRLGEEKQAELLPARNSAGGVEKENREGVTKERTTPTPGESTAETPKGTPGAPGGAGLSSSFSSSQEIEAYFITRLNIIGRYYEGRLNGLLSLAWNEYGAAQKLKGKAATFSLAPKYIAAGNALEKECDQEFYAVLAEFKAEMRKNSFPLDKAFAAQREYERAKAARKKQIFRRAAKLFLPP